MLTVQAWYDKYGGEEAIELAKPQAQQTMLVVQKEGAFAGMSQFCHLAFKVHEEQR